MYRSHATDLCIHIVITDKDYVQLIKKKKKNYVFNKMFFLIHILISG